MELAGGMVNAASQGNRKGPMFFCSRKKRCYLPPLCKEVAGRRRRLRQFMDAEKREVSCFSRRKKAREVSQVKGAAFGGKS